jgi:hypothetical protein
VSAAEGLLALSHFIAQIGQKDRPDTVDVEFAYGPSLLPQRFITQGTFHWSEIQQAAQELVDTVRETKQLPSIIWVAGKPLRPEDFAVTLASVAASERYSSDVPMHQGELEAKRFVADNSPQLWQWVIFPKGFDAPGMMEIAKLQAWTIKPAVLCNKY